MKITGVIENILDTQEIPSKSGSVFRKREFWLNIKDGSFTHTIAMELHGDKMSLIDDFAKGNEIEVDFNIKGRVFGEKCYNTLSAWKITLVYADEKPKVSFVGKQQEATPIYTPIQTLPYDDDLPF